MLQIQDSYIIVTNPLLRIVSVSNYFSFDFNATEWMCDFTVRYNISQIHYHEMDELGKIDTNV